VLIGGWQGLGGVAATCLNALSWEEAKIKRNDFKSVMKLG
jgi:hypothetical protein